MASAGLSGEASQTVPLSLLLTRRPIVLSALCLAQAAGGPLLRDWPAPLSLVGPREARGPLSRRPGSICMGARAGARDEATNSPEGHVSRVLRGPGQCLGVAGALWTSVEEERGGRDGRTPGLTAAEGTAQQKEWGWGGGRFSLLLETSSKRFLE